MTHKGEEVSLSAYRKDYIHPMEAPEVFRSVRALDIYEGFSRHPNLRKTIRVDGVIREDMVQVDEIGLFQRVSFDKIANAFGLKDLHCLRQFFFAEWGEKVGAASNVLVADFLAYVTRAQNRLFKSFPENNGQITTYPFMEMNSIALPEYYRERGKIPVSVLKDYLAAVLDDLKETGALPRKKLSGLVNAHYQNIAFVEGNVQAGDEFIPTRQAFRALRPYFSGAEIKHYLGNGKLTSEKRGVSKFFKVSDLQSLIKEHLSAGDDISRRALERELARDVTLPVLKMGIKNGSVHYATLLLQPGLRNAEYKKVQDVMEKLNKLGIMILEPDAENVLKKFVYNYRLDSPPDATKNPLGFYFWELGKIEILDKNSQKDIGKIMIQRREEFAYKLLRNPHAARKIAVTIEDIIEKVHGLKSASIFTGEDSLTKMEKWSEVVGELEKMESMATKIEKELSRTQEREGLVKEYRLLQDKIENRIRGYGLQTRWLAKIAERFITEEMPVKELDTQTEILTSHQLYRDTRDCLIKQLLRLVVTCAKRYSSKTSYGSFTDRMLNLISIGNTGAIDCIDRWNPELSAITTYGYWWIRQNITRYMHEAQGMRVGDSHAMREAVRVYEKERKRFFQTHFREPSLEEISKRMSAPIERLAEIRLWSKRPISLDQAISDDEESRIGDLMGKKDPNFEKPNYDVVALQMLIKKIVTPRQWKVLYGRFYEDKTLEEVAEGADLRKNNIGASGPMTRERIRQIEEKALETLQNPVNLKKIEKLIEGQHGVDGKVSIQ